MRLLLGKWANERQRLLSAYYQRVTADGGQILLTPSEMEALRPAGDWSWFYVPSGRKAGTAYAQIPESNAGDLTVTRASVANEINRAGVISEVAANVGRLDFLNGVFLGQPIEPLATNLALHRRDLTNAVWVRTNMNAVRNQIGVDGVANTATRITATAGNATILQAITSASAQRIQSFFIRRATGSGTIQVTQNNGATWTTVTLAAGWNRVNTPSQTLANPVIGIRIVTNGDAVDVDVAQQELGAVVTSPIISNNPAAIATRQADVFTRTGASGLIGQTQGTIYAEVVLRQNTDARRIFGISDGSASNRLAFTMLNMSIRTLKDGNIAAIVSSTLTAGTHKMAIAYNDSQSVMYINGSLIGTSAISGSGTYNRIDLGQTEASVAQFNDRIRAAGISQRRWANWELANLTRL